MKNIRKYKGSNLLVVLLFLLRRIRGRKILAHDKVKIKGLRNIFGQRRLKVGLSGIDLKPGINIKGDFFHGNVDLGQDVSIYVAPDACLQIEDDVLINSGTRILCYRSIFIGRGTKIGWNCELTDYDFHPELGGKKGYIEIGENTWIGKGCTILKNTFVGSNCKVGACSVLSGKYSSGTLIVGNPAKIIENENP